MSEVAERFLRYVRYDTRSDGRSETCPSTEGQRVLAEALARELKEMGIKDATVDENGYVTGTLPANMDRDVPTVGFIAHMDTSPEVSGAGINPRIIENYDGGDIVLNSDTILSPKEFPHLRNYTGKTLITTDGTTLLGADDKAGVAEIVTAVGYLIKHPEIEHGTVKFAFTPDEEIGRGVDRFNVERFHADFAYTMDGGEIGELSFETFNAASCDVLIHGKNIHPGDAKGKMKNAILIASEFAGMLPPNETPACTDGYDGFYHIIAFNGTVEKAELSYIIRDFDKANFEKRKETMESIADKLNKKYGNGTVEIKLKDQYYNMKEKLKDEMYIVDIAKRAMEEAGIEVKIRPVRGGTDGARLSYMGLPTPNIFSGGHNYHGRFEYIPVESMEKAVDVIVNIVKIVCK